MLGEPGQWGEGAPQSRGALLFSSRVPSDVEAVAVPRDSTRSPTSGLTRPLRNPFRPYLSTRAWYTTISTPRDPQDPDLRMRPGKNTNTNTRK
jgi:hypothetical protein